MESVLFLVKKILGQALMPIPLVWLLLLAAGVCVLFKLRTVSRSLLVVALFVAGMSSLPVVAHWLALPLEQAYPKYGGQPVAFVVVHGNGHSSDPRVPITSLLTEVALMRLAEGIRIYQANPGAKLLLSGYGAGDDISQAEAMAKVAEVFGVPREDMLLRPLAKDTEEEARAWVEVCAGEPFAVVTSAVHMPRTLLLYHHLSANPVPAPTQFSTRQNGFETILSMMPRATALVRVERAWYEYLGLLWLKLKGY